jgi:uncharacterized protein YggU (UPF0235/DUF167 family)
VSGPARLDVRVTPGARRNAWAGRMPDGRRKLKIAAPPLEGRANEALVAFVARSLGLPRRAVRLTHGAGGRDKRLEVDLAVDELELRLVALAAAAEGEE